MTERKTEFNECEQDEWVVLKNEQNDFVLTNDVGDFSYEANARPIEEERRVRKRKQANKLSLKMMTTFIFACVAVATIQTSIYIPLFSDLFSNPVSASEPAVVEKPYVSKIEFANFADDEFGPNRYLKYRAVFDESFSNFEKIYYDVKNLTDNTEIEGPFVEKSGIDSYALWTIPKTTPKKDYQIRVWCANPDPSKLKYTETKTKDEYQLYLIYTEEINY